MRRYRVGIVGAGFIGAAHTEALRRLGSVEVAALCDLHGAREKAGALGIGAAYGDYREMLDRERLDAVHVCTPNFTHYQVAKAALERGVHVLCEKPFTLTAAEAGGLCAIAKARGLRGAVNFHNRFYPMAREMRERVRSGQCGRLFTVHGEYLQDWLLYPQDYTWRLESKESGKTRALADIGSHWMDLAEFVCGCRIREVNAIFSTVHEERLRPRGAVESFQAAAAGDGQPYRVDTEDCALVAFRMEGGAVGSLICSQVFAGRKNRMGLSVAGEHAALCWDLDSAGELWVGHRDAPNELVPKDPGLLSAPAAGLASYPAGHAEGFPDAFKQAFDQFYASIGEPEGEWQYATFEDGRREMVLCERIRESAETGRWVKVEGE